MHAHVLAFGARAAGGLDDAPHARLWSPANAGGEDESRAGGAGGDTPAHKCG